VIADGAGYFLATLSKAHSDNWAICKREGLWGSGDSNHAVYAARQVEPGDVVFIWLSGAGLLAAVRVLGPAVEVVSPARVPWPEPARYRYTFPIEVIAEVAPEAAVPDRFPNNRSERFGIRTHQLQSGFIHIEPDQARILADALGLARVGSATASGAHPDRATPESSPTQRPAGAVYLRPATSIIEAMLGLWRQALAAGSQDGVLLVVGEEEQRWVFDREVASPPFIELADRFKFTTPEEVATEIRQQIDAPAESLPRA
jgi:hypothetical protein